MATLTVLAIGNGVLPLMLTVSPVSRSSAATPTSADLFATRELSCCSRLLRLAVDAAAAGCATNAKNDKENAIYRMVPPLPACRRAHARLITKCPHSFQIVKVSYFRTKNMDDHVIRIDQHPVRCRESFDPDISSKSLFYLVRKLNGHRCDLPRRAPRCDHHVISNVRLAAQRDRNDLLRLVVIN